mgnify:CR=1 FL=1
MKTESHIVSVQIKTTSFSLREEFKEIIEAEGGAYVQDEKSTGYSDLLIMDVGSDVKKDFELLGSLKDSGMVGEIFLTSAEKNREAEILRMALHIGAKEFFPQPVQREDVRMAYLKFLEHSQTTSRPRPKQGKIINICGCKGGIGVTTIAVNLATALIQLRGVNSVVLVDMHYLTGDVPIFLNMQVDGFDWADVARNMSRIDATYLDNIITKHPLGISVIPPPSRIIGDDRSFLADATSTLLSKLKDIYDFIIVDSGQPFEEFSAGVLGMSDRVLMVTILSLPHVISMKRIMKIFRDLGYPNEATVDVIVNRFEKRLPITLKELEENLKKGVKLAIPNDYKRVLDSINKGEPLVSSDRDSGIAKSFFELASMISGKSELNARKSKQGLFNFF